ncbi:protease HtpX [Dulcicalothrix desertica PCC 7102]|uniref:Protease HtpX homolog n=1 Tax=Dulcicalothrix desertica PCC 7102 TaxID=232991 RepID=A0A433VHJ4_9CYAN|nr:zinc metalloprotease HtpX [Dulcicalothrix desertica]RUT05535.1 protease HtpX [Dulcicalothrix desertica PCC 7102]TWH54631.1 heat shock protein [Dulcicalothrix desertica PCC 7102]
MGNQFKTLGLLAALSGLLIAISYYFIGGTGGLVIGIGLAAATNLFSWYQSDRIALAVYGAQEVNEAQAPRLYRMVQKLSQRAGLPMPRVCIVPGAGANAFATGRDPEHAAVAVTEGIMSILPEDELEAVIAHELTHISNRDTLTQAVAATVAGAISFLAQNLFWFGGGSRDDENRGGNFVGVLLTMILAPLSATVIQMAISRTREFAADAGAARITGNPRALARALQRLEATAKQMPMDSANPAFEPLLIINPFSGGSLANLFRTHPTTEKRIEALLQIEQQLSAR